MPPLIHDATPASGFAPPPGHTTGLIPRNYRAYPPGYQPCSEVFPQGLIIPEGEQQARLDDQIAQKASLFDLREANYEILKSLDQDGYGYCTTADTEVLTERGWTPWPEYNGTDLLGTMSLATGNLEFQAPLATQVFEYDGEMIYSTNGRLDFGVTPNHRMLVRKWDERRRTLSDAYSFVTAENLGWYVGLPHATQGFIGTDFKRLAIEGDREYDGDDFLALLGLVVSDGYAGGAEGSRPGKGTMSWVSFASFREGSRPEIEPLAARLGFHESPSRRGVWARYDAPALAAWIRANCYTSNDLGAVNKRVPDLVKCASMRQIAHFLHYFDDRNRSSSQFYSRSWRMMGDLQELFLRVGKRSSIGSSPAKDTEFRGKIIHSGELYTLTVSGTERLCLDRRKHIERDRYKGLVYCATVPNSTLVTRRNGSMLISGNCWAFSTTKSVMYLRAAMGEPGLRLSAWMVASIIKNYRDEGGWGAESLEFWAKSGGATLDEWPQGKVDRQYDTPAMRTAALARRVTEWWDGTDDRSQNTRIMISAFLMGLAPVLDFNWWGHSVCGCRLVTLNPLTIDIDNSWGESAGERGIYRLQGSKAIPDGIVVPRVATPTQT